MQQHGYAHGSVISYVADDAIAFASGLVLGCNGLTSEKSQLRKPGLGQSLIDRAVAKGARSCQAVRQGEICTVNDGNETPARSPKESSSRPTDPDRPHPTLSTSPLRPARCGCVECARLKRGISRRR
jgi:hypothetical protein